MSFIAPQPELYAGQTVGDGHCVAYVKVAADVPQTTAWVEGVPVWSLLEIPPGLAIATFTNGLYANATDGSSHAAILIERTDDGLRVWDQWVGHPVAERLIRFKAGDGLPCDDGDAYSVIEVV